MPRCLIIEDEPLAQLVLERYISRVPAFEMAGKCSTALEAFKALHSGGIDLLFLDIRLPLINGMDFLKSIKDPPLVVFTTAYPEYAAQSYDLEAVDYLLKPITEERFRRCVDKILQRTPDGPKRDHVILKVDGSLVRVPLDGILYIESLKDYVRVVTATGAFITHMTMKAIEGVLPAETFIRIHRSYLVALSKVSVLSASTITVGEKTLPVGETYRSRVAALRTFL